MPQNRLPSPCEASKLELELVLNAVDEGLCGLDASGNVTFCNDAFLKMTGYQSDEIVGTNLQELLLRGCAMKPKYGAEDLDCEPAGLHPLIHTVGGVCWRKDGSPFPSEFWLHPLSRPLCATEWLATVQDISERKHAEEKLLFEAALLEAQSETTLDGILVVDANNKVVRTNQHFALMFEVSSEILALKEDSFLLRHVTERVENPETFIARVKHLYSHPEEKSRDEIKLKNGRIYDRYSAPLIDSNGRHRGRVWYFRDITEQRVAEKELRLAQFSLEHASDDVHWVNSQGQIVYANAAACRSLGRSREELLTLSIPDIDPLATPESWPAVWQALKTRGSITFEAQHKTKQGREFPVEVSANYLEFDGQEYDFAFVRDITGRKQAEEALRASEKRYRLLFERNLAGVFRTTLDGRILQCNPAAAHMFGYAHPEEAQALSTLDIYHPMFDREAFLEKLKAEKSLTNQEVMFRRKDGASVWAMVNLSLVDDDPDAGPHIIEGTLVDITERKIAEDKVQSLAYFDALTGLPNRTLLRDRLSQALAMARRQKHRVALLFLDLDRFKTINDSLGHSAGDLLLQEVADRLKGCAREQDTVSRLGGDEFLIVLNHVKDIQTAVLTAERFMDAMTAEFSIQGHALCVSCSLGISVFPEDGADAETLIKNADAAMYSAKDGGRNNFRLFTAHMNAQAVARLTIENGLRVAIDKRELFLVYQPQMDIATGKIVGLEALVRWQHPELGLVPPTDFIRVAENTGLIMSIGEWVLRTACSQLYQWQAEGLAALSVSVNVSAVQFRQEAFTATVHRILRETGLSPQCLELELTESLLLSNADVMFLVLRQLKAMGVRLAIDDFGTGYSSLSYLKRFPVGRLKIDASFIRDVPLNSDDAAITVAIISMGKSLNLKVIAEGVENEAQMSFLRTQRCDEIQGYYFSKPLAVDDVPGKLRSNDATVQARAQASGV
jgi:diguanylate cyclase (GGDEF)-like protein/PAS domain S-box-containing protein